MTETARLSAHGVPQRHSRCLSLSHIWLAWVFVLGLYGILAKAKDDRTDVLYQVEC
jgi:hypothetical protein